MQLAALVLVTGSLFVARVDAEPEQRIYDRGEIGVLVIHNFGREPVAVGGCNPSHYEERIASHWMPDPLLRLACAFGTSADGSHELDRYEIIRPRSSLRVSFPTHWINGAEGVIRVKHRVSVGCGRPRRGRPLRCSGVAQLVSDPILIVEPGTADAVAPR
jgi:hypothetical protein